MPAGARGHGWNGPMAQHNLWAWDSHLGPSSCLLETWNNGTNLPIPGQQLWSLMGQLLKLATRWRSLTICPLGAMVWFYLTTGRKDRGGAGPLQVSPRSQETSTELLSSVKPGPLSLLALALLCPAAGVWLRLQSLRCPPTLSHPHTASSHDSQRICFIKSPEH